METRGLPLISGRIPLRAARDWIESNTMIPQVRRREKCDLCSQVAGALFQIWLDLQCKQNPAQRKQTRKRLEELRESFAHVHSPVYVPAPSVPFAQAYPGHIFALLEETHPPEFGAKRLSKEQQRIRDRVDNGLALNLREIAIATGYSISTISKWRRDGLPLIDGKLPRDEALRWRRQFEQERTQKRADEEARELDEIHSLLPAVLRRGS